MIRFNSQEYFINDIREWDMRGELVLSPKFQRRMVWTDQAKSYLMDTIVRGYPISKIFMRHDVDPSTRRSTREIIDGQQRLSTILSYLNDGFKISTQHNEEYGGLLFSQLPDVLQRELLSYKIAVDVLLGATDHDVLDIFARLNTYTVQLNKQELLNAKYMGLFKQTVYQLGKEYVAYWRRNGILKERAVSRMGDAEFASELMILMLDGPQDRKNIPDYYERFDKEFDQRKESILSFRQNIKIIQDICIDYSLFPNFTKKSLFYSLFGILEDLRVDKALFEEDYPNIRVALRQVNEVLDCDIEEVPRFAVKFYDAATKHISDASRRQIRHEFIKEMILGKVGVAEPLQAVS